MSTQAASGERTVLLGPLVRPATTLEMAILSFSRIFSNRHLEAATHTPQGEGQGGIRWWRATRPA